MNDKNRSADGNGANDDAYVIEDTGDSVADIEHEMEVAAREAVAGGPAKAQEDDFRDRYVRTLADFENFRKRSEREKDDFRRYALVGVIRDLLPVIDNFDRALEHAEEDDEFHKGVALIYKQLFDVLQRHGLKPITESGVRFDPNIHEAVVREEDPSVPSHTVVAILQKGYFLHDRLLRPALVKVAVGGLEENGSADV
ncbi:MAG TPA: nucleotide exchange factor GrpE [Thermoanaerobaculia bacterium]|nr:nucleotide exchange factor GrpE [Thermoanaerobaculia bacterium]